VAYAGLRRGLEVQNNLLNINTSYRLTHDALVSDHLLFSANKYLCVCTRYAVKWGFNLKMQINMPKDQERWGLYNAACVP